MLFRSPDVGLTVLSTPKDVSAIRHVEANKYSAVFLAELPNGLQIAGLHSGTAARPSGHSAINRCTANKEGYMAVQRNTLELDAMSAIVNYLFPNAEVSSSSKQIGSNA